MTGETLPFLSIRHIVRRSGSSRANLLKGCDLTKGVRFAHALRVAVLACNTRPRFPPRLSLRLMAAGRDRHRAQLQIEAAVRALEGVAFGC